MSDEEKDKVKAEAEAKFKETLAATIKVGPQVVLTKQQPRKQVEFSKEFKEALAKMDKAWLQKQYETGLYERPQEKMGPKKRVKQFIKEVKLVGPAGKAAHILFSKKERVKEMDLLAALIEQAKNEMMNPEQLFGGILFVKKRIADSKPKTASRLEYVVDKLLAQAIKEQENIDRRVAEQKFMEYIQQNLSFQKENRMFDEYRAKREKQLHAAEIAGYSITDDIVNNAVKMIEDYTRSTTLSIKEQYDENRGILSKLHQDKSRELQISKLDQVFLDLRDAKLDDHKKAEILAGCLLSIKDEISTKKKSVESSSLGKLVVNKLKELRITSSIPEGQKVKFVNTYKLFKNGVDLANTNKNRLK